MVELTSVSSDSYVALQHEARKARLARIRSAAFKELTKPDTPPPEEVIVAKPICDQYFSIYDLVMKTVCAHYNVRSEDVLSNRRLGKVVKARHAAIVMLFRFTKWTTFKIADRLKRDPSTVFYVLQKQEAHPEDYSDLERLIQDTVPKIKPAAIFNKGY